MGINRREALRLTAAMGLGAAWPARLRAAPAVTRGLFVLVDRIGPGVAEPALRALLEPLGQAAIPVGLALAPGVDRAVARMVGLAAADRPDLFEVALRIEGLDGMRPYAQMRAAALAGAGTEAAMLAAGVPAAALPRMVTAVTDVPGPPGRFDALRALGLRNVLAVTPGASWATSVACDGGALCLQGGVRLPVGAAAQVLGDWLARFDRPEAYALAVLDAGDLATLAEGAIRTEAEALAARIVGPVQAGTVYAVPPREHLGWFDPSKGRWIGLRLVLPPTGDDAAALGFADLRAALDAAGLPYALGGATGDAPGGDAPFCPDTGDAGLPDWVAARLAPCAAGDPGATGAQALAQAGLGVLIGPRTPGTPAVDDDGLIRRTETWNPADLALAPRGADLLLALTPSAYRDADLRARTLAALRLAAADPMTRLRPVTALAADLIPDDPVLALLRETRATRQLARAEADAAGDRDRLMADAAQAWRYVETHAEPLTGLCPATVHVTADGSYAYRTLTMWDMGSLIHGTIAAQELGLIADADFVARAEALVRALPATRIGGAMLPNETIASDRIATLSDDFNICDTGRLLGALRVLDAHPLVQGIAAPVVAGWDLARMAPGGRPQSVREGQLRDSFGSHCTHYTALAFRAWGSGMASPYEVEETGSPTDRRMRLLYAAADIGALGAEPLLLEAVETGLSAPSAALAEVLHAAQLRATAATGLPVCVSESPLDRAPWFVYAGLRLNDAARRFEVRANSDDPAYQTEEFQRSTLLVSTKAAFLWAAVQPDAHARRCLALVRDHAPVATGGFSPGVHAATAQGMPGYADINTSGVVLEAVAYVLRGRRPRLPQG